MGDNTGRLAEIKWGDYDVLQGVPKSISSLCVDNLLNIGLAMYN